VVHLRLATPLNAGVRQAEAFGETSKVEGSEGIEPSVLFVTEQ
jgi:hypothetical protein